jgi:aquaporin Z
MPPIGKSWMMGMAMGCTAVAIIYSPWGKYSGAHMNPAITFTMLMLRKMDRIDACFYMVFQFLGALTGLFIVNLFLKSTLELPAINYIQTLPGDSQSSAFGAEYIISFLLSEMILISSNHKKFRNHTGLFAGILIILFIAIESPFSGMSMNPARTIASAFLAQNFTYVWIYFLAPVLGMLSAAFIWKWVICKKNTFHCSYHF